MTRVLRKACRACTAAKRRCIVQLPQCSRCRTRQIDCVYDLEPLVGSTSRPSNTLTGTVAGDDGDPRDNSKFLRYVSSLHMDPKRVALECYQSPTTQCPVIWKIPISADFLTVEYVARELLDMANSVALSQSAAYIHPQRKPRPRPALVGPDFEVTNRKTVGSDITQCTRICDLLCALYESREPLSEILQAFQILLGHVMRLLLSSPQSIPRHKEKLLGHTRRLAIRLVKEAPSMMPTNLSRWEAWILAESVRRAILMSCLIQGVYHGRARGYCYHELFIQALPFDVRPGMWAARSEREWEALLDGSNNKHGFGSHDATDLVAFHEFASSFARAPFDPGADTFQRLLLMAHHGKAPVDRVLGVC
ncbi:Fungal Zn2-Cys6 binuclear cluster domain-containing protein isoform 2 [Cladophialophora immunda]|nr:Fungal Zn2-Cys6 binuclear cluster domain-containing protein isoform 2 [Cladophialophora immunda]